MKTGNGPRHGSRVIAPDEAAAGAVRLFGHGVIRHGDPLARKTHAVVSVLRGSIDVIQCGAIGVGATQ